MNGGGRSIGRIRRLLATALLAVVLGGCGGAAKAPGPGTADALAGPPAEADGIVIHTESLPPGQAGEPYGAVALEATAESGLDITWRLHAGTLPPGLELDPFGSLWGTPTQQGLFVFTLHVTDGRAAATRTLAVAVDAFGLWIQDGLVAGEAWEGRAVALRAAGQAGAVRIVLPEGESGRLLTQDEGRGTARYLPAFTGVGDGVEVTLRAEDLATGRTDELVLSVRRDPTAPFVARFGESDVWFFDVGGKAGAHAYATDFHAALARAGFRHPDSTDTVGTQADELAARYVYLQLLREVGSLFLHVAEGEPGAAGLAVSLPYDAPQAPYTRPQRGSWLPGAPDRYSVLSFSWASERGVFATAQVDSADNALHENDTSSPERGEYGVFLRDIVATVNAAYGADDLLAVPIGEADVPALRALIHGLPDPGGRYAILARLGGGLARSLAAICAHEIGHGLGLQHPSVNDPNSVMSAQVEIGPHRRPAFTGPDVDQLRTLALPGVGRVPAGANQKPGAGVGSPPAAVGLPAGGVCVCRGGCGEGPVAR